MIGAENVGDGPHFGKNTPSPLKKALPLMPLMGIRALLAVHIAVPATGTFALLLVRAPNSRMSVKSFLG